MRSFAWFSVKLLAPASGALGSFEGAVATGGESIGGDVDGVVCAAAALRSAQVAAAARTSFKRCMGFSIGRNCVDNAFKGAHVPGRSIVLNSKATTSVIGLLAFRVSRTILLETAAAEDPQM